MIFFFFFFFASGGWRTSTLFSTSFFRILCRLVLFYPESFIVSVKMFNFNICWTSIGSINNSKAFASPMAVYFKRNQEERNIKSNAYWVANFPQIRTRTSHCCCRLVIRPLTITYPKCVISLVAFRYLNLDLNLDFKLMNLECLNFKFIDLKKEMKWK